MLHIIKMKMHSSCETEDFVETHLCKLCVILRSRASLHLIVFSFPEQDISPVPHSLRSAPPSAHHVACTRHSYIHIRYLLVVY